MIRVITLEAKHYKDIETKINKLLREYNFYKKDKIIDIKLTHDNYVYTALIIIEE